jgi:hypothetical protein
MTRSVKLQCASVYKQITASVLGLATRSLPVEAEAWPLAKVNHLLLALWRSQPNDALLDAAWRQRLALLAQLETETAEAVRDVIPRFVAAGLPLLTIKSFLPFPYVDSNLDLVTIRPDCLPKYVNLLHTLDYRRYRNLADLREPMKQTYQGRSAKLRLHLHTAVSWNGIVYLPWGQVWQRRRAWKSDGGPVWIPSAEDELLIMAAHAWFENKLVSLHELLYWYRLVTDDLDWAYVTKTAQQNGWYRGVSFFMAIMSQLATLLDIPVNLPAPLPSVTLATPVNFPYIFPLTQNWQVTGDKLVADVRRGFWQKIPRQLFSYLLVDHFWMYRKAYRKRREALTLCS